MVLEKSGKSDKALEVYAQATHANPMNEMLKQEYRRRAAAENGARSSAVRKKQP
jgi:hypothetical protein